MLFCNDVIVQALCSMIHSINFYIWHVFTVPGPPIIIYFPQVNETSATIVWQPPEEPNGIIIRYLVSYKQRDQPDSVLKNNSVEHEAYVHQYTVGGLTAETYYVFSVQARTQDGWGEAAVIDVYTIASRGK